MHQCSPQLAEGITGFGCVSIAAQKQPDSAVLYQVDNRP
jgi:hypothetical protein